MAPRAAAKHCSDEMASLPVPALVVERVLRLDESVPVSVEAPAAAEVRDVQVPGCLDATVSVPGPARVGRCWEPVGSALESFPVSSTVDGPPRQGARWRLHRVARGSPKPASCGLYSPLAGAASARPSWERAADARPLFLPAWDEP